MNNQDIKKITVQELYNVLDYIKTSGDNEYRIRCPFCGDSQKSLNTGHLYIHIDTTDSTPMLYNCFRCGEHGIVDDEFLSIVGIYDNNLKSAIKTMNKHIDSKSIKKFIGATKLIHFDYKLPEIIESDKTRYIENRLGVKFNEEDFKNMKVITSLKEFLITNHLNSITCPPYIARKLEKNYVGFLSFGNSHILFRDITGKEKYRWIKYPITKESKNSKAFYSMSSVIDIFSQDEIIINMGEGVLDILGAYANFDYNKPNMINIAICGKHYLSIIYILIDMGLVGKNITINIFADNDEKFNNKNNKPTTIEYFKKTFKNVKHIYKDINIFYNEIGKDIGVPKKDVLLKRYRI